MGTKRQRPILASLTFKHTGNVMSAWNQSPPGLKTLFIFSYFHKQISSLLFDRGPDGQCDPDVDTGHIKLSGILLSTQPGGAAGFLQGCEIEKPLGCFYEFLGPSNWQRVMNKKKNVRQNKKDATKTSIWILHLSSQVQIWSLICKNYNFQVLCEGHWERITSFKTNVWKTVMMLIVPAEYAAPPQPPPNET